MQVNLRGTILGKYRDISSFAKAIGWNRKKASDIINEKRRPTAHEMEEISDLLNINDADTFMQLFFSIRVHNVDK